MGDRSSFSPRKGKAGGPPPTRQGAPPRQGHLPICDASSASLRLKNEGPHIPSFTGRHGLPSGQPRGGRKAGDSSTSLCPGRPGRAPPAPGCPSVQACTCTCEPGPEPSTPPGTRADQGRLRSSLRCPVGPGGVRAGEAGAWDCSVSGGPAQASLCPQEAPPWGEGGEGRAGFHGPQGPSNPTPLPPGPIRLLVPLRTCSAWGQAEGFF